MMEKRCLFSEQVDDASVISGVLNILCFIPKDRPALVLLWFDLSGGDDVAGKVL